MLDDLADPSGRGRREPVRQLRQCPVVELAVVGQIDEDRGDIVKASAALGPIRQVERRQLGRRDVIVPVGVFMLTVGRSSRSRLVMCRLAPGDVPASASEGLLGRAVVGHGCAGTVFEVLEVVGDVAEPGLPMADLSEDAPHDRSDPFLCEQGHT
jgi:hypothetical protein